MEERETSFDESLLEAEEIVMSGGAGGGHPAPTTCRLLSDPPPLATRLSLASKNSSESPGTD